MKENIYLIILGDMDNRHFQGMADRMNRIGSTIKVFDNMFVLTVNESAQNITNMEEVRNYIAGKDLGYCFVIKVKKNLSCAWNVPKTVLEQLVNVFNDVSDENQ